MKLIKDKKYLEKILPHKKPMILIDNIIDYNFSENWLRSFTKIEEDSLFYDKSNEGVSSLIGIEYMAQTIGCYAFLKAKQKKPKGKVSTPAFCFCRAFFCNLYNLYERFSAVLVGIRHHSS